MGCFTQNLETMRFVTNNQEALRIVLFGTDEVTKRGFRATYFLNGRFDINLMFAYSIYLIYCTYG